MFPSRFDFIRTALLALCAACGTEPTRTDTATRAADPSETVPFTTGWTVPSTPSTPNETTVAGYTVPLCSGTGSSGGQATGTKTSDGDGCGGPPSCGHYVDLNILATEVPVSEFTGGKLLDGIYVLVAFNVYAPKQQTMTWPADIEQVLVVEGDTIRGNMGAAGSFVIGYTQTFETDGTVFRATDTCPQSGETGGAQAYVFDGSLWRLLGPDEDKNNESVFAYLGQE